MNTANLATGGDFDDRPTDYNFCTNGIVFADRTLTTKMAEVKYCYQPFTIACTPQGFTIRNEFLFTDTTPYSMTATLCKDGGNCRCLLLLRRRCNLLQIRLLELQPNRELTR